MTPEYRSRVLEKEDGEREGGGKRSSVEELWKERWTQEYDQFFASNDER